jgi:hypothetical protein
LFSSGSGRSRARRARGRRPCRSRPGIARLHQSVRWARAAPNRRPMPGQRATLLARHTEHGLARFHQRSRCRGWSIYGAERAQTLAIGAESSSRENGSAKRNPPPPIADSCEHNAMEAERLPWAATRCRRSASLRGRRSISLKRQVPRTRRPTGLDRATLTGGRTEVEVRSVLIHCRSGRRPAHGDNAAHSAPVSRTECPAKESSLPSAASVSRPDWPKTIASPGT